LKSEEGSGDEVVSNKHSFLVPITLFAPLGRRGLGTRIEEHFDFPAKDPPAKRSEKGYGDENENTPQQCRIVQTGDTF